MHKPKREKIPSGHDGNVFTDEASRKPNQEHCGNMAASAVCYTLHSWSTGLSLFKEKRRTQCEMLLGRGENNGI